MRKGTRWHREGRVGVRDFNINHRLYGGMDVLVVEAMSEPPIE